MNFKFATPLLLGSALTLSAIGFVACGGDDNGVTPVPGSSSSQPPEPLPEVDPTTSITFSGLGILYKSDTKVQFKGEVSIVLDDDESLADPSIARFADIKFDVRSKSGASTGTVDAPAVDYANNAISTYSLQEMGVQTLLDEGYTECGDFTLYITATKPDGTGMRDSISFTRPEEKCKAPEISSSSVQVPGAPMDSVTVRVSTKSTKCVVLTTNPPTLTAETTVGDICFNRIGTTVQISSGTGLKFATFANVWPDDYGWDMLPTDPVTTDNFTYNEAALQDAYPDFLSLDDQFFVAVSPTYTPNSGTAVGFYAFIAKEISHDPNNDRELDVLIYKAK